MVVWKIADLMRYTGLSRKAVIHMLNSTDAPVLPRKKNQTFLIPSDAFVKWWEGGKYEEV